MKLSVKKPSNDHVPQEENQGATLGAGFLGAPGQLPRHKKPRDSFAVMRTRDQKHTVGVTLPAK